MVLSVPIHSRLMNTNTGNEKEGTIMFPIKRGHRCEFDTRILSSLCVLFFLMPIIFPRVLSADAVAPLPEHPGNIFIAGEEVLVAPPEGLGSPLQSWRAVDENDRTLYVGGMDEPGPVSLGQAAIGWYRVEYLDVEHRVSAWTSCAVVARPPAVIREDTPICVDSAVSWFARNDPSEQKILANLGALASVGWVRDRLSWRDIEPERNAFAPAGNYDQAAEIQAAYGTGILQVFHDTPKWAADPQRGSGAFPPDLRDAYHFCAQMGARFLPYVKAWEPWNEANIRVFGGHTVDEMCSYQKAAYLGFKSADPHLHVGWNAFAAGPTRWHARGLLLNEAAPYFDSYNFHTYDWHDSYLDSWDSAFIAASGKPVWITEADRGTAYATGEPWFDQTRKAERLKAEWLPQSYATSLFCGVEKHFHFILGHYKEENNGVQFGLLRKDFTPRPAYSALAALGRFLHGGRCLGRWSPVESKDLHFYAFRAFPDGKEMDVLLGWAEQRVDWPQRGNLEMAFSLPGELDVIHCYDHLGRDLGIQAPSRWRAPVYVLLPPGALDSLELEPAPFYPPEDAPAASASTIVFQFRPDRDTRRKVEERPWTEGFAWALDEREPLTGTLWIYNFGQAHGYGEITVENSPDGVQMKIEETIIVIEPGARKGIPVSLQAESGNTLADIPKWLVVRGDFGNQGNPVLAIGLSSPVESDTEKE
jgi:hypothetical protein